MATQEIDDFTALTTPAAGDLLPIVDVSDTTDSPEGTTKKIAVSDLVTGATVPDDSVTNAKLANMVQSTIKGRATGAGTGDPTDLTATQATAILNNVVGDSGSGGTKGLVPAPAAGDAAAGKFLNAAGAFSVPGVPTTGTPFELEIACSDESTVLVAGTAVVTFRMPRAITLTSARASLKTAASSGTFTVDINEGGSTILSTKITIDATEKTSVTAATPPVISDSALADDAEMTIDIDDDAAGDAVGLKIVLIGTRA